MQPQTELAPERSAAAAAGRRRVVVTGAGVVSPLGDSPAALHRALAAGTSARKPIELFETSGIGCHEAGEIRPFDPQGYVGERNLRPLDRTSRLLVVAAQLALADSGWAPETLRRPAPATDAPAVAAGQPGEPSATAAPAAAGGGLGVGPNVCRVRTLGEVD